MFSDSFFSFSARQRTRRGASEGERDGDVSEREEEEGAGRQSVHVRRREIYQPRSEEGSEV